MIRACEPWDSRRARSWSRSAAERTNESATKSASSSAASARSSTSLSVIAGSSGRAQVTLMPLRADSGPAERTRATTSPSLNAVDREARDAVADHDLAALGDQAGEVGEVDDHAVGAGRDVAAEHDGLVELRAHASRCRRRAAAWDPAGRTAGRSAGARGRRPRAPRAPGGAGRRGCRASSSGARSPARRRSAGRASRAGRWPGRGWPRSWCAGRACRQSCSVDAVGERGVGSRRCDGSWSHWS